MKNELPRIIHPFRMARSHSKISGTVAVKELVRIKDLLLSDLGEVQVDLDFGIDESGQVIFSGHIICKLVLQCQRCCKPMDYQHETSFQLAPMLGETGNKLSSSIEPLMLEEDAVELIPLIEDEILLALPIIPKHENKDCNELLMKQEKKSFEKINPFSKILVDKLKKID